MTLAEGEGMGRLLIVLAVLVGSTLEAGATILTFDVAAGSLPEGYGDSIGNSSAGGLTYLEGAGFTPNVTIEFVPDAPFGVHSVYQAGYAFDPTLGTLLPSALGHGSFDVPSEIVLTPTSGAQVVLHGFDIGTWNSGTYSTEIRIWDENGSRASPNLFSYSETLGPGVVHSPLTGVITATGALHIFISNLGSTGLDNLHFSQVVPEPSAAGLLLLGACAALRVRRRRA